MKAPVDIIIELIDQRIEAIWVESTYWDGYRDGLKEFKDDLEGFKKLFEES